MSGRSRKHDARKDLEAAYPWPEPREMTPEEAARQIQLANQMGEERLEAIRKREAQRLVIDSYGMPPREYLD